MEKYPPLRFGVNIGPLVSNPQWPIELAKHIDHAGLDLGCIQDHLYQTRFLDMWTVLTSLVHATQKLHFFPNVANMPMHQPVLLAKAAASLDVLSGGRIELGLGAGTPAFWNMIAMRGPRLSPGQAVDNLAEAIQIMRLYWEGQPFTFKGDHYTLVDCPAGPVPAHPIEIWVGALSPRMLALTGKYADGWIPSSMFVSPDQLNEKQQQIDEAALAASRQPSAIKRSYNLFGFINSNPNGKSEGAFQGPIQRWVDSLVELALTHNISTFLLWPGQEVDQLAQIELFGKEVVPRVREAVQSS